MTQTRINIVTPSTKLALLEPGSLFLLDDGSGKYKIYRFSDITNVDDTTTVQSAIDNKYVEQVRSGYVEPTLKTYQAGETFHINELFTDNTKTKFYVAEAEFTATGDFETDKNNGFFKDIGQSEYKQIETSLNAGESISIPLTNQSMSHNRYCFVKINKPSETSATVTADRFASDSFWDYDPNWSIVNNKLGLLHSKNYNATVVTNSQGTRFAEYSININDYRELLQITGLFGA